MDDFFSFMTKKRDYFHIGSTGFAQVGTADYEEKARFEGKFLLKALRKIYGDGPKGTDLRWKAFPYEIGAIQMGTYQNVFYHEVIVWLDTDNKSHVAYANRLEGADFDALEIECQTAWDLHNDAELTADNEAFNLI